MASLRLSCSPSIPNFSTEFKSQTSLHKPFSLSNHIINNNNSSFSLSWSLFHSFSYTLPIRTSKTSNFLLHFSSTTQDSLVDSSSVDNVSATETEPESQSKPEEEEEFSTTRLLAQNVPWTATTEDIRALFHKYGTVLDVELSMYNKSRNRGLAFVTMGSPEEALAALNSLESYEFEGRKLKMNYAKLKRRKNKPSALAPSKLGPTFNLFIGNLPFQARDNDLKEFFTTDGANVVAAEVIFHDNPRRPSGYGFVGFRTKKEADEALSTFQGKEFMGRPLRVAHSRRFVQQQRNNDSLSNDTSTESNSNVEAADASNDN